MMKVYFKCRNWSGGILMVEMKEQSMKRIEQIQEWRTALAIPAYLIRQIGDAGMEETYSNGERVDSDDLRLTIMLTSGHQVLVPGNGRIVLDDSGGVTVEVLM